MGIDNPSVVPLGTDWQKEGFKLESSDPNIVFLTDDGRAMVAIIEDALQQLRSRLLREVSDADLEAAIRVFDALETATGAGPA